MAKEGSIVDVLFVNLPRQRNSKKENAVNYNLDIFTDYREEAVMEKLLAK